MAKYDFQQYLQEIPKLPPVDTSLRLQDFSENLYNTNESTHLYKFVDALTGDAGVADLKKQLAVTRLNNNLDSTHFFDLDRLFGNLIQLERLSSETYPYNPFNDMLTDEQWDEVRVKDSWYRARCKDFLTACSLGGTPEGIVVMAHAALGITCDVYEIWRYMDDLGVADELGRTDRRNEVVIRPHKESITPREKRILLHAIDKIRPLDTIITIDVLGVGVHKPVTLSNVSSDSTYFEVIKTVTGSPDLDLVPPPEYLLEEVFNGEDWIRKNEERKAPTTALNSTQESSIVYTYYDENTTMIESVEYTAKSNGKETKQKDFVEIGRSQEEFSDWISFAKADSPDNYPGGRNGQSPYEEPALNKDGSNYVFPYSSQEEYEEEMSKLVLQSGGKVIPGFYAIRLNEGGAGSRVLEPTFVFSPKAPSRQSTVTSSWYGGRVAGSIVGGEDFD